MAEIILRLKKYYLPLLSLVFIAGIILRFTWNNRDAITFITQATGFISIIILTISLIIGSLNLILKYKNPISTYLRRDISIVGGVLAVIHSITGLFVHLRGKNWQYFFTKSDQGYAIRLDNFGLANYSGLISTLIIILLLIISNDYSLKKLNPVRWKNIQRLSYLMFILVLVHCYFYRIGKQNLSLFYSFYIPLILVVLTFQMVGVKIKLTQKNN
jgi:methionine sulfoxide reductase heme-binding subunit